MTVVYIVLVSVCLLLGHYSLPLDIEPSGCSSYFDFQEKLLEKNVRMELSMDNVKTKVETDLATCQSDIRKSKTELQDMHLNITTEMKETETKLKRMELAMDNEKNKMETDLATCQSDIRKLKTELQDMRSAMTTKLKATETKLSEIQEEAEQKISALKDLAVKKDVVFHVKDIAHKPTGNNIIKFKEVVSNTDNVYNINTGYFTAPVDGTYWFAAQLCTSSKKYLSPTIYIRGTAINRVYVHDDDKVDCATVNAVAVLQKGDNATLKSGPSQSTNPVYSGFRFLSNTFMGTLLN